MNAILKENNLVEIKPDDYTFHNTDMKDKFIIEKNGSFNVCLRIHRKNKLHYRYFMYRTPIYDFGDSVPDYDLINCMLKVTI